MLSDCIINSNEQIQEQLWIICLLSTHPMFNELISNTLIHYFFHNLQDYNNKLAQLRAGKSSKSKLLLAKFKSADSLNGWDVRQGTYFQDAIATKYDGGMDARFEFTENEEAVFSGKTARNDLN